MAEQQIKQIIRICSTDLKGNIPLYHALTKVQGISYSFSNALCNALDFEKKRKVGSLSPEEIKNIEQLIQNPEKFPSWLLNRRKDLDTGKNKHIITSGLKLQKEFDIKSLRKIKCYRGMRHSYGLPVRGQRTKAHFRKGASLGVQRKAAKMKKGKK